MRRYLSIICLLAVLWYNSQPTSAEESNISTLEVCHCVRGKGLKTHPLDHYCGILLMQRMAEVVIASRDAGDFKITRNTIMPYATGQKRQFGNFASYRSGGNGVALLLMHRHLPEGRKKILTTAKEEIVPEKMWGVWPLMDNLWVQQKLDEDLMTITLDSKAIIYDFKEWKVK